VQAVSTAPLRAVLFDWDGTLADSAECSYRCYVKVFEAFGKSFGREDFERTYSPNWHRTYVAMGVPEDRWTEADSIWLHHYAQEKTGLLPGARAALERLRAEGFIQGLVTSGERERIERELGLHGLHGFFGSIICGGEVPNRKPHPEALVVALERLGVVPAEAAYIGDSPEDVEMSQAAGGFVVGIPGGFPNQGARAASKPDLRTRALDGAVAAALARRGPLVALARRGPEGWRRSGRTRPPTCPRRSPASGRRSRRPSRASSRPGASSAATRSRASSASSPTTAASPTPARSRTGRTRSRSRCAPTAWDRETRS